MTPYDLVKARYTLPHDLYPFQGDTVNELGPLQAAGYYLDVGTGPSSLTVSP